MVHPGAGRSGAAAVAVQPNGQRTAVPEEKLPLRAESAQAAEPKPRWRRAAEEVTSHCSYVESGGRPAQWFRVVGEFAYVRSSTDIGSQLLGLLQRGGLLQGFVEGLRDEQGHAWVELTPLMKWRLHIDGGEETRAYTLVDGTPWGAGMLLQELQRPQWPAPDSAERAGLRWSALEDHTFRPRDGKGRFNADAAKDRYLCRWNPDPPPVGPPARIAAAAACAVGACCMLRGAMPASVESWLLYYLRIGFRLLYLFFDDPSDPALPVARRVAAIAQPPQAVRIQECSRTWWAMVRRRSRFYRFRRAKWAAPVVDTHEEIQDVQCRQQLCVDIALQDAYKDGVDWLLHVDIDELLYFPEPGYREAAPGWFSRLGPDVDLVKFHNHECVPEDLEVEDWFRDVTLFKPNLGFLALPEDPHQPPEVTPPPSADEKTEDEATDDEEEEEKKRPLKGNAVDEVLKTVAFARTRHMKELALRLPDPPRLRRWKLRQERRRRRRAAQGLPPEKEEREFPETFTHFMAYGNGKAAVRVRTAPDERGWHHPESVPLPCGVHSFMQGVAGADHVRLLPNLRRRRMDGSTDPVVLHYANCGLSYWDTKYKLLGDFPDSVNGKQNSMRAHLAARDLAARRDRRAQELFYRMFIMSNSIGELPLLFTRGLVLRIDGARRVVEAARSELAEAEEWRRRRLEEEAREERDLQAEEDRRWAEELRALKATGGWRCSDCGFETPLAKDVCIFCETPRGCGLVARMQGESAH